MVTGSPNRRFFFLVSCVPSKYIHFAHLSRVVQRCSVKQGASVLVVVQIAVKIVWDVADVYAFSEIICLGTLTAHLESSSFISSSSSFSDFTT